MAGRAVAYTTSTVHLGLLESDLRSKGEQQGVYRRRNGAWHVEFKQWEERGGKTEWVKVSRKIGPCIGPTRLNAAEARQIGYERYVSVANGPSAVPQGLASVRQFVAVMFMPGHVAKKKPAGQGHYRTMLNNHVLPAIGEQRLRDVNGRMVQAFLDGMARRGLSSQTVLHARNVVSAMFRHAKKLGYWRGDLPTEHVETETVRHKKRKFYSAEENRLLLEQLDVRDRALVALVGETGLRIGEALGLRWGRLNTGSMDVVSIDGEELVAGTLAVREQYTKNGWQPSAKTDAGERDVPVVAAVCRMLDAWRALAEFTAPECPVFAATAENPVRAGNLVRDRMEQACKRAGIEWLGFHAARHNLSDRLDGKVTDADRAKVLGHSNAKITNKVYSRGHIERVRAAMEETSTLVH